jgi:hypothetical protein
MNDILSGGREGARNPEEKAMSRLRNWLVCDDRPRLWSGSPNPNGPLPWSEVVCILAGIDPEASADADASGLAFLPGALESYGFKEGFPKDPDELLALNAGVAERIGMLIGFRLTSMSPEDAISKMVKAGFPIPWLPLAMKDPLCEPHLPKGIPEGYGERRPSKFRLSQKAKQEARLESDDMQVVIRGFGREAFDALRSRGFEGCKAASGRVNVAAVARQVREGIKKGAGTEPELWPEPRTLENRVRKWLLE